MKYKRRISFKMQNATFNSGKRTQQSLNCGTTRREVLIGAAKAGIAASMFSSFQPSFAVNSSDSFNKYLIWDMHGHLNTPGDTPREKINNLLAGTELSVILFPVNDFFQISSERRFRLISRISDPASCRGMIGDTTRTGLSDWSQMALAVSHRVTNPWAAVTR